MEARLAFQACLLLSCLPYFLYIITPSSYHIRKPGTEKWGQAGILLSNKSNHLMTDGVVAKMLMLQHHCSRSETMEQFSMVSGEVLLDDAQLDLHLL